MDKEDKEYIEKGMLGMAEPEEKLFENVNIDEPIAEKDDYFLYIEDRGRNGFLYSIYKDEDDGDYRLVYSWISYYNASLAKDITKTIVYRTFLDSIEQDKADEEVMFDDDGVVINSSDSRYYDYDDDYDDDDYLYPRSKATHTGYNYPSYTRGYTRSYSTGYSYTPKPKEKGFFDKYTKSNTLVFHKTDSSTDMLAQIYEGKGWDVLRSTYNLDEEELFKVVDAHERIVCLGHGSSYGLIGMFGGEMAPHLKDKKLFVIWCNADGYFKQHNIGKGQFITGNMPSEVWECSAAGCGSISAQLMLENITYWSKLCADVCEKCLNGDVKSSVDYIRKNYLEQYGNHPVTIYNSNRTQCLGEPQPLPSYQFKGKPLTGADIPYEGYNQEEFLKNPTEKIPYTKPSYNSNYWWNKDDDKANKASNSSNNAPYKQLSLFDKDEDEALKDAGITVIDNTDKGDE